MHEQTKINEAKYFLSQVEAFVNDRNAHNFNLSAFLAAARSVLQYALKEAKERTGGQAWYEAQVGGKPIVRFFKDKRDINIHANPVSPSAKVGVTVTEHCFVSDSLSITVRRSDGTIEEDTPSPPAPRRIPQQSQSSVTFEYFFADWPGEENVIALCAKYLSELEEIVSDGVTNGFLTPSTN